MFEWRPIRKHYFEIWIEFYTTDKAKKRLLNLALLYLKLNLKKYRTEGLTLYQI